MSKAQTGLGILFVLAVLGVIYFAGLAGFVGATSSAYVLSTGMTGIEGWFFTNINFVMTIGYILSLLAVGYFGLR